MNRFYLFLHTSLLRTILISCCLLWCFTHCRRSAEPDHADQLKIWIDSLDRNSRKVGIKKSVKTLDSLMATLGKPTLSEQMQYYKFMKVLSHRDSTMDQNALKYTDSLLQLFPTASIRKQYPIEYSKALLLKGDDLLKQKAFYQAYRNYYNGKAFLTGLGEICECARYSSRIANVSFKEGNYYQAIEYWKQELKELAECQEPDNFQLQFIEKQGSLRNIGIAHLYRNEPDIALRYFQQATDFIDKHAHEFPLEKNFIKFARLVIKKSQAEAYALKGETKAAGQLIKSCLEHDNEIDWSVETEQESHLILTRLYIDSNEYYQAQKQLSILKSFPKTSANSANEGLYEKLQASIFFGQGKFEEASKLLIANLERDRMEQLRKNAENKSDVGELLQQIQREHEHALTAEKDAREDLILKFSILISITLCVIVYLIWRSARKKSKNIKAVTKLNKAITQRNIVLQDTVNALEQAEIENEAVLRIVAHDLRSPIAAMVSASHLVFWEHVPTDDQLEIITSIQHSGEMASALIGQIMQSSSDREKISKSDVALQEIVQSCIDMLQHKANEKQQMLDFQYEEVIVAVDREKIWRVFCNLLSNAIKFSQPGSTVWINLERKKDQVLLSVSDNGIGIPANLADEIFLPSNKARRSGTAGEQSYGIGLSICRQIVDAHGGRIWFESALGSGTTFFVELPV